MSEQKKISVIMPSLNQGSFIEEAIRSVIEQDYPNTELLVVDGGSSDNTANILKKYAAHITWQVSEKDNGQSEAINKGLSRATGDIITWLNSDDAYLPGALQKVAAIFASNPRAQFLHGRAIIFGNKRKEKTVGPATVLAPEQYLPYMRFPQPASFFRRSILEKTGPLNEHLHFAMDHELVARAVLLGAESCATNEALAKYRLHASAKTVHENRFMEEWTEVFAGVLNSVKGAERYVLLLQNLNLYGEKKPKTYPCSPVFSEAQIQAAFLEHLHLHFHYHYRNFNRENCARIAEVIKKENSHFALSRSYRSYLLKLKTIPPFLFKLKRRFSA